MARKILVVDDEKLIVKGIRFGLEQDGMEVDAAYDGEEALEYVRANSYDMINALKYAVKFYHKPEIWKEIIKKSSL